MRRAIIAGLFLISAFAAQAQELRGHGGPVRALAVSSDGKMAISGSFDSTAIVWSLERGAAQSVLQFHNGSVNAVAILPDGRYVTAGEDARIAIWKPGPSVPEIVLEGHTAPIAALAVSPDGRRLASAAWDGTVRVWPLEGGGAQVLEGHQGNVNGVGFLPDSRVASAGYDASLRIWSETNTPEIMRFPAPLNTLAVLPDGRVAVGGADGRLRVVDLTTKEMKEIEIGSTPVISIAIGTRRYASAVIGGVSAILSADRLEIERTLVGPGIPVWSLAFLPNGDELLTGGGDRIIRRWNAATGETIGPLVAGNPPDPLAGYADDPGAQVFRACVACHTLRPDEGLRAGPTLYGIMGRRIASVPGYPYSEAFRTLDIIWTPETVAKLFELGPHAYTPGTKMPEQTVNRPEDREALVRFLERVTK
ncbi:c-type cytochrome [Flaviflagellibacter deserti]|uniref:C-type cytochrome n=1 Tax=Flaviflagellibacter deserti TaxID=2267266 RepID=A0ABV9Z5B3_9HYPH